MTASDETEVPVAAAASGKPAKGKSSLKKRVAIGGVGIAVIVGTFVFVLPRIADYRAVWSTIQGLTWQQGLALAVAGNPQPRSMANASPIPTAAPPGAI